MKKERLDANMESAQIIVVVILQNTENIAKNTH